MLDGICANMLGNRILASNAIYHVGKKEAEIGNSTVRRS